MAEQPSQSYQNGASGEYLKRVDPVQPRQENIALNQATTNQEVRPILVDSYANLHELVLQLEQVAQTKTDAQEHQTAQALAQEVRKIYNTFDLYQKVLLGEDSGDLSAELAEYTKDLSNDLRMRKAVTHLLQKEPQYHAAEALLRIRKGEVTDIDELKRLLQQVGEQSVRVKDGKIYHDLSGVREAELIARVQDQWPEIVQEVEVSGDTDVAASKYEAALKRRGITSTNGIRSLVISLLISSQT